MATRFLTALPVYNEASHVVEVLREVLRYSPSVLVVDDGSSDGTAELLAQLTNQLETESTNAGKRLHVVGHAENRGYGAALRTAFEFALGQGYEVLVTVDCDGQHEPKRIPRFVEACREVDIVSGSRYLRPYDGDSEPPRDRRWVNRQITDALNRRLRLGLTDAFCGFKAYRVAALKKLHLTENGYALPLELWVQAWAARLRVIELPVPLIYLDEKRSFGVTLDDPAARLAYYHRVIDHSLAVVEPPRSAPSPLACDTSSCGTA